MSDDEGFFGFQDDPDKRSAVREELIVPSRADDRRQMRAPESPFLARATDSISSGDSHEQPVPIDEMATMLAEDQKKHDRSLSSSTSSSSDASDSGAEIPEPMAPISPNVSTESIGPKGKP